MLVVVLSMLLLIIVVGVIAVCHCEYCRYRRLLFLRWIVILEVVIAWRKHPPGQQEHSLETLLLLAVIRLNPKRVCGAMTLTTNLCTEFPR